MSSSTWVNYGYGVCLRKLEFNSVERIQELLSHAPGFRNSIYETFRKCGIENPTLDDYLEADQDFDNGMAYLLQGVIEEAENFQLTACDDYEGDRYLIFQAKYPWDMRFKDLFVTKKKIRKIISKYLSIVTDSEFSVGFEEAEGFG